MTISIIALLIACALGFCTVKLYERHRYAACLAVLMLSSWSFIGSVATLWKVASW